MTNGLTWSSGIGIRTDLGIPGGCPTTTITIEGGGSGGGGTSEITQYLTFERDGTYYGMERSDDSRWLIKKLLQDPTSNTITLTFANEGNNPGNSLATAWSGRVGLVYHPLNVITGL